MKTAYFLLLVLATMALAIEGAGLPPRLQVCTGSSQHKPLARMSIGPGTVEYELLLAEGWRPYGFSKPWDPFEASKHVWGDFMFVRYKIPLAKPEVKSISAEPKPVGFTIPQFEVPNRIITGPPIMAGPRPKAIGSVDDFLSKYFADERLWR
jgi:hypothetical protein